MKKIYLIIISALTLCAGSASAQCAAGFITIGEQHVRDTTYEIIMADTTLSGGPGYTYSWTYNGTTITGAVVSLPVTVAGSINPYVLTVTGPGCTASDSGIVTAAVVFNCSVFAPMSYEGSIFYLLTQQGTDLNSVRKWYSTNYPTTNDLDLKVNVTVDWGNGRIVSETQSLDTFMGIGGNISSIFADTANSAHYIYAGQYEYNTSYYMSYGTLTCPVVTMAPISIHVGSALQSGLPVITGSMSYCLGDTLNLGLADTTAQFHNILHTSPIAGTASYYPDNLFTHLTFVDPSSIHFAWFRGCCAISLDSTLRISNLTLADTGLYYLHVYEEITGTDTALPFRIAVNNCAAGVATVANAVTANIYPNPTNGSFTIELPQPSTDVTVTITDVAGRTLQTIKPAGNIQNVPVSLDNLPNGTYLVKIDADGKTYRNKVVRW